MGAARFGGIVFRAALSSWKICRFLYAALNYVNIADLAAFAYLLFVGFYWRA